MVRLKQVKRQLRLRLENSGKKPASTVMACFFCAPSQEKSTIHHVFTTHFHGGDKAVARNEIADCKWVPRDKLNPSLLKAPAAGLIATRLPAMII